MKFQRKVAAVIVGLIVVTVLWRKAHRKNTSNAWMEYDIATTWDDRPIDSQPVHMSLAVADEGMVLEVRAPFFNDPPNPGGTPGQPFDKLWEYEVVEAFFVGDNEQYLEVEVSPHGQHQVLVLRGARKPFKLSLPMKYEATIIDSSSWKGRAIIPWEYFPPQVSSFNAFAIHGSGDKRAYWSMAPVPTGTFKEADFHRLEYFRPVNYESVWPKSDKFRHEPSPLWKNATTS